MQHKFTGLDSLRTLMALSVATGHYFYWNATQTIFPRAFFLAVDFFFVLSGFVLTRSTLSSQLSNLDDFVCKFIGQRLFRLYPLYILLFPISAMLVIASDYGQRDPAYYYITSAMLLQSIGFDGGYLSIFNDTTIGIAWSISVEFWVGLLWFPVVFALRRQPALLALLSTGVAIFGLLLIVNFSPNAMDVNFQRFAGIFTFGSIRGLLGLALGTVGFIAYEKLKAIRRSTNAMTCVEIATLCTIVILYCGSGRTMQNEFVAPVIFLVLILTTALGPGLIKQTLTLQLWEPARPLSYAIYLIHPFYVFAWRQLGLSFSHLLLIPYLILVIVSAVLAFHWIEKPWIRRGRRILRRC